MRLIGITLGLIILTACVEDVGKDRVKATVEDVPEAKADAGSDEKAEAEKPTAAGDALKVDPSKSMIQALGAKVTATHPIDFKDFEGEIKIADGKVSGISFTVTMATLESDHPKLTEHLKTDDFFDVEKHGTSTFTSVEVREGTDSAGFTHTVVGDLTVRGKTKRITFPAKVDMADAQVKAETEFVLNRDDFGITYPGRADDLIQDNVRMTIKFVAPRQA